MAEEREWDCPVYPVRGGGMPFPPPPPQMPPPLRMEEKQGQTAVVAVDLPPRTPCRPDGCHRSLPLGVGCCSNSKTPA